MIDSDCTRCYTLYGSYNVNFPDLCVVKVSMNIQVLFIRHLNDQNLGYYKPNDLMISQYLDRRRRLQAPTALYNAGSPRSILSLI